MSQGGHASLSRGTSYYSTCGSLWCVVRRQHAPWRFVGTGSVRVAEKEKGWRLSVALCGGGYTYVCYLVRCAARRESAFTRPKDVERMSRVSSEAPNTIPRVVLCSTCMSSPSIPSFRRNVPCTNVEHVRSRNGLRCLPAADGRGGQANFYYLSGGNRGAETMRACDAEEFWG